MSDKLFSNSYSIYIKLNFSKMLGRFSNSVIYISFKVGWLENVSLSTQVLLEYLVKVSSNAGNYMSQWGLL